MMNHVSFPKTPFYPIWAPPACQFLVLRKCSTCIHNSRKCSLLPVAFNCPTTGSPKRRCPGKDSISIWRDEGERTRCENIRQALLNMLRPVLSIDWSGFIMVAAIEIIEQYIADHGITVGQQFQVLNVYNFYVYVYISNYVYMDIHG